MSARKQKLAITVSILVFIAVCIFIYYKSTINDVRQSGINLSDIEQMNIGAEMPLLLYANHNSAIMQGTFGLVVYRFGDSMVTNRMSYEQLKPYDISMLHATVSQDGTTIFVGNDDMYSSRSYTHQYNIRTRVMKKILQQPVNTFKPIHINTAGYNKQYDKYFDLQYLINNTIVQVDDSFVYLRANSDWSMKSLQIVVCKYANGKSKVYDVF